MSHNKSWTLVTPPSTGRRITASGPTYPAYNKNSKTKKTDNVHNKKRRLMDSETGGKDPLNKPTTKRNISKPGKIENPETNAAATLPNSNTKYNKHNSKHNGKRDNVLFIPRVPKSDLVFPDPEHIVIPEGVQQKCIIRRCPILYRDNVSAVPHQSRIQCMASHHRGLMQIYKKLNICEAPWNFDSGKCRMIPFGWNFDNLIIPVLHILYGSIIVPDNWVWYSGDATVTRHQNTLWRERYNPSPKTPNNPFGDCTRLEHIIQEFNTDLSLNICLMSIWVYPESGSPGHAMLLLIERENDTSGNSNNLTLTIIDPYMEETLDQDVFSYFLLNDFCPRFDNCTFVPLYYPPYVKHTYQRIECMAETCELNRNGYCAIWTLFIMEIFTLNYYDHVKPKTSATHVPYRWINYFVNAQNGNMRRNKVTKNDKKPLSVINLIQENVYADMKKPEIWRKLIIDYMFSRLLDAYAIASVSSRHALMNLLYIMYLEPYVNSRDDIMIGRIIHNMCSHLPWLDKNNLMQILREQQNNY